MKRIRIIATISALVMMFGSTMSVFAISYHDAYLQSGNYQAQIMRMKTYSSDAEKTKIQNGEVAAGDYYDAAVISSFSSNNSSFAQNVATTIKSANGWTSLNLNDEHWNDEAPSGIETDLNTLATAYNDLLATKVTSDGSKYGSKEESAQEAPGKSKEELEEEERQAKIDEDIKAYQEKMDAIDNSIEKSVTQAVEKVNSLVASGNMAEANATKAQGVTIDLAGSNVCSLGLDTYDMLDKATTAGVPATLDFAFGGKVLRVTIPAGVKVSDLCFPYNTKGMILLPRSRFATEEQYLAHLADYNSHMIKNRAEYDAVNAQRKADGQPLLPKPYCGFLNLTANYGFTVVK